MTRTSIAMVRLSIVTIVGGAALFLERRSAAGFAIVAGVVSGSQDRTPADADELCRGCPAYHAPGGGVWGGCRGGCRRGCVCGDARLRADTGHGRLRPNSYGLSVMTHRR